MDSNSELLLNALRYFNDNRHETKTRIGLEKHLNVNTGGANNILSDLDSSKYVKIKTSESEIWEITEKGEIKINDLQKSKDSESTRRTIWSAAVIIGIIQIVIGVIQICLACESSSTKNQESEPTSFKTLILEECHTPCCHFCKD